MTETDQQWLRDNALTVLDSAVDAIITIDAKGIIQSVNRATLTMFGYAKQELVGQPLSMLMPEPYRSHHDGFVEHYLETGKAGIIGVGRELIAQAKDGRVFPIYLAISDIDEGGQRYFAGIVRDISDQKAAQAALLEQQERLAHVGRLSTMGEMTASIAHEINQPLTAIAMYAQASLKLLERDDFDKEKLIAALDKLNKQSLRAGAVIERIQRFVRNESGQKELANLNTLIRDVEHLAAADARLHGIDLEFDLDPDLPDVFCDPIQIQQVALNLLRNAVDAMDEVGCQHGNTVKVGSGSISDDLVEVRVVDAGTGVAKDQESLVF
ncbi:MAG: PAS domain S-box protein, partial [Gammaproteobacteria bacterium]|nr:PAS domain S-box protein [Gammaproteobacteria bacterium]